jgi:uncharacterized protein
VSGHVFISYSHDDGGAYVQRLVKYLADAGIPVWRDSELITGNRWTRVIQDKIDTCSACIVLMTPQADESEWVSNEIQRAKISRRPIFPLLVSGQSFFVLGNLQHEDVSDGRMPSIDLLHELRLLTASDPGLTDPGPTKRLTVVGVRVEVPSNQPIVLLREADGERYLPIWVGSVEATAIAYQLQGVKPALPLTHDLFRDVLNAASAHVDRATIHDLQDNIFVTSLTVNGKQVRTRPSDAIALSLRMDFPVNSSVRVLEKAGILIPEGVDSLDDGRPDEPSGRSHP